MAVNFAMALNPFTAIAAGVAALVVGIIYAYNKFDTFRTIVNAVLNGLITGFEVFANAWINTINTIIRGMNILNPFSDIPSLPTISLPRISGAGGGDFSGVSERAGMPTTSAAMPSMPAPAAPLALAPSSGGGGGGGMSKKSQGPGYKAGASGNKFGGGVDVQGGFNINVYGGISTSAEIGKSVVDAIAPIPTGLRPS